MSFSYFFFSCRESLRVLRRSATVTVLQSTPSSWSTGVHSAGLQVTGICVRCSCCKHRLLINTDFLCFCISQYQKNAWFSIQPNKCHQNVKRSIFFLCISAREHVPWGAIFHALISSVFWGCVTKRAYIRVSLTVNTWKVTLITMAILNPGKIPAQIFALRPKTLCPIRC